MTAVDLWAALAAGLAGSAMAIRARMLRPHHQAWTAAPPAVWMALNVAALGLLMAAVTIFAGSRASAREAMVYSLLALCSGVMLWNLNRNGRQAEAHRQALRRDVATVLEAAGTPARYPGEGRR